MELAYNPQTLQQALTYNQGGHMEMNFTQPLNYNQNIAQENMQIEPYQSQPAKMENYNPNIGKLPEIKKYLCTLCQTPTYYDTLEKLEHHHKRLHEAFFNQTERGTKRKKT